MDPKAAQRIQEAFMHAIFALNADYIALMHRCGVKQLTLHRF